jgi:hypothetical protein
MLLHELEGFGPETQKNNTKGNLAIKALRKAAEEDQIRPREGHERERGEKEEIKRGGSGARY